MAHLQYLKVTLSYWWFYVIYFHKKTVFANKFVFGKIQRLCYVILRGVTVFDLRFFSFFQQEDFEILGSNVLEIYSMVQCSTPHTVIQRGAWLRAVLVSAESDSSQCSLGRLEFSGIFFINFMLWKSARSRLARLKNNRRIRKCNTSSRIF